MSIIVKESHINNISREYIKPFNFLRAGNFRDWVLDLFNREDYILAVIDLGVVLGGNHGKLSVNDILIHTNGDRFLLTWKRGTHAILQMMAPRKYYKLKETDDYSLAGGYVAILGSAFIEGRK